MSDGAADATLHIRGLTVARGNRQVVSDVSLEVPPGEVTALLGPNGAGKSSLVLAVGGVLRPLAGTVALGERNLTRARPEAIRQAGVAIVPEGRRLLPALTVEDNLKVATYTLRGGAGRAARERALDLFPELRKRLGAPSRLLSGGEQQMVVLAQALVSEPKVVVIDELSLGLAPVVVSRLIPTLRTVCESGVGVLLIEQFATVALGLANRAYIMNGGRIEYSGDAAELRERPELLHMAYLLRATASSG
jgi:branched-chain amino acid transport system ATP-binding protein